MPRLSVNGNTGLFQLDYIKNLQEFGTDSLSASWIVKWNLYSYKVSGLQSIYTVLHFYTF